MKSTRQEIYVYEGRFRISDFGFRQANPQFGFTLTELLVVITIIAILASLITAGAMAALAASKRAAITTEIGQLADAVERFKNDNGGAYPPNAMSDGRDFANNLVYDKVEADFVRSFRKAFPRHKEPDILIRQLVGDTTVGTANGPADEGGYLTGGMNAAEAVYFWLGGFSSDPVYPISGAGGPSFADEDTNNTVDPSFEVLENRNRLYEFVLAQLGPRSEEDDTYEGRYVQYKVDLNGTNGTNDVGETRRINLWTYTPKGVESSYAYFDSSRYDPVNYDLDLSGSKLDAKIFALKKIREGLSESATPKVSDIQFVNKGKYQILHAGLDDTWGDFTACDIFESDSPTDASNLLLFPAGPFTGDIADTLTNFTQGTLESAQE